VELNLVLLLGIPGAVGLTAGLLLGQKRSRWIFALGLAAFALGLISVLLLSQSNLASIGVVLPSVLFFVIGILGPALMADRLLATIVSVGGAIFFGLPAALGLALMFSSNWR
jgi:hypothetical protein